MRDGNCWILPLALEAQPRRAALRSILVRRQQRKIFLCLVDLLAVSWYIKLAQREKSGFGGTINE